MELLIEKQSVEIVNRKTGEFSYMLQIADVYFTTKQNIPFWHIKVYDIDGNIKREFDYNAEFAEPKVVS